MNGEEWLDVLAARLVALVLGDGVRGIRPPARWVEKMPRWLLEGVDTDGVAIVSCFDRLDNSMCRSFPASEDL